MENNKIYESPETMVIDVETEGILCNSFEPISEEDW